MDSSSLFCYEVCCSTYYLRAHTHTPPMAATTTPPLFIDTSSLRSTLTHSTLIHHLRTTLPLSSTATTQTPHRTSHSTGPTSTLLLMPCWSKSYIGVKLVTHHPENNTGTNQLPSIHGTYTLFDCVTGRSLAVMDGSELTLYRTSCVSGLGSAYLSREDSEVMVMVGAGALAPHLIRAHVSAMPSIKKVIIWNRSIEKATALAENMQNDPELASISFESNENLSEAVEIADIVSCATNSETPLVLGTRLKPGAHLDLVGSFRESMRECDDEAIKKGRVYVDNDAAMVEAGELVGAFKRGVIRPDEVAGTLVELIKGEREGRRNKEEITVFKSVGSAIVDLLAAQLVYETCLQTRQFQN